MAINTTNLNVTTVAAAILSSATTWGNTKGASLYDPMSFILINSGSTPIRVGASALTSATGFPVAPGSNFTWDSKRKSDVLFAVTTASTSNVDVMVDR